MAGRASGKQECHIFYARKSFYVKTCHGYFDLSHWEYWSKEITSEMFHKEKFVTVLLDPAMKRHCRQTVLKDKHVSMALGETVSMSKISCQGWLRGVVFVCEVLSTSSK